MKTVRLLTVAALSLFLFAACSNNTSDTVGPVPEDGETLKFVSSEDIVMENIINRKSIRQFTVDKIPSDQIEKILHAGFSAPSAMNRQPWAIEVVTDSALLRNMSADLPSGNLKSAAVAFIVLGDMERIVEADGPDLWIIDCSLMAENMILAANSMGIGCCFTGVWPDKERADIIRKHLSIPSKYEILGMIPMGYPAEHPDVKDNWRPEAVHYNAW